MFQETHLLAVIERLRVAREQTESERLALLKERSELLRLHEAELQTQSDFIERQRRTTAATRRTHRHTTHRIEESWRGHV